VEDLKFINYGSGIGPVSADNNDIEFGDDGDFVTVGGHQRVLQNILKAFMTTTGANRVFPSYGTSIAKLPQRKVEDLQSSIKANITYQLAYLNAIEESTLASENIKSLDKLAVAVAGNQITMSMTVGLKDGSSITSSVGF
jgi:hypothetical protein